MKIHSLKITLKEFFLKSCFKRTSGNWFERKMNRWGGRAKPDQFNFTCTEFRGFDLSVFWRWGPHLYSLKENCKKSLILKILLNDRPKAAMMQRGDSEDGLSDGGILFLPQTQHRRQPAWHNGVDRQETLMPCSEMVPYSKEPDLLCSWQSWLYFSVSWLGL